MRQHRMMLYRTVDTEYENILLWINKPLYHSGRYQHGTPQASYSLNQIDSKLFDGCDWFRTNLWLP